MVLSHVIALNNHAARSSHRDSVAVLRLALTTLRDKCQVEAGVGNSNENYKCRIAFDATPGSSNSALAFEASAGSAIQTTILESSGRPTSSHPDFAYGAWALQQTISTSKVSRLGHGRLGDSYLEVFDDLLIFPSEGEVSRDIVAAVILFNLAVLRHTAGIRVNRSNMLMQARNVYLMALAVLESFSAEGGDIPTLLLLPIFNNLAAVEAHFYGYEAMSFYLDCGLALSPDAGHGWDRTDLSCFFRNTMLPIPTVAAAA